MLLFGGAASSIASLLLFVTMLAATYTHYALGEPVRVVRVQSRISPQDMPRTSCAQDLPSTCACASGYICACFEKRTKEC